jgi:hypothetical protein
MMLGLRGFYLAMGQWATWDLELSWHPHMGLGGRLSLATWDLGVLLASHMGHGGRLSLATWDLGVLFASPHGTWRPS